MMEESFNKQDIDYWIKEYKNSKNEHIKEQLRTFIVIACTPLVKKISHGLARRNTDPIEDLIQVGSVGLLKAIDNYDLTQGSSFKNYATYLIKGEIRHYLRDKSSMIRAPRELQELSYRVNQIIQKLTVELGEPPSDLEIAGMLQIPVQRVNEVTEVDRRKNTVSLDYIASSSNDSDQPLIERLVDSNYQEKIDRQEIKIILTDALEMLDEDLKKIVLMSYFKDMSQQEIADELGISQMQVSRKIKKALNELFNIIKNKEEMLK